MCIAILLTPRSHHKVKMWIRTKREHFPCLDCSIPDGIEALVRTRLVFVRKRWWIQRWIMRGECEVLDFD